MSNPTTSPTRTDLLRELLSSTGGVLQVEICSALLLMEAISQGTASLNDRINASLSIRFIKSIERGSSVRCMLCETVFDHTRDLPPATLLIRTPTDDMLDASIEHPAIVVALCQECLMDEHLHVKVVANIKTHMPAGLCMAVVETHDSQKPSWIQ